MTKQKKKRKKLTWTERFEKNTQHLRRFLKRSYTREWYKYYIFENPETGRRVRVEIDTMVPPDCYFEDQPIALRAQDKGRYILGDLFLYDTRDVANLIAVILGVDPLFSWSRL